jgi:hypothetical protein
MFRLDGRGRLRIVFTLLALAAVPVLHARDIDVPGEKVRLTVPDNWRDLPLAGSQRSLEVEAGDHTGAIFLDIMPNPKDEPVDSPQQVEIFKQGMMANPGMKGIKVTCNSSGPVTLDGIPGYQYEFTIDKPGHALFYLHCYNFALDGKGYAFSLRAPKAESDLRALEKVMQTVHFSGPRVLPGAKPLAPGAPVPEGK